MQASYINEQIKILKKTHGRLMTNIYQPVRDGEFTAYECGDGILYEVCEPNKTKVYYAVKNEKAFKELIQHACKGSVLEYIHKDLDDLPALFNVPQLQLYKTYIRITICYKSNPYEIPEEGRRMILQQMYDPTCGVPPTYEDIDKLDQLMRENFDVLSDDIFTREQWGDIIKKKECLCYKESGIIRALYVWRLEGKKLYSNISLNTSVANFLYNMERRVFEEMWEQGIRIYYAWFDIRNSKALRRHNKHIKDAIESESKLYNTIYLVD